MKIDRRTFVKGALAGAAAGAAGAYGWLLSAGTGRAAGAVSAARRGVVLLQSGTAHDHAFAAGVEASMGEAARGLPQIVRLSGPVFSDWREIRRVLDQAAGKTMLGMMDDAGFSIFSGLARASGARLACLGQHTWGGDSRYGSCHSIISVPRASGIGTVIGATLGSDPGGLLLTESVVGMASPSRLPSLSGNHGAHSGWAFLMGQALGAVSAGIWVPQSACSIDRAGQGAGGARQSAASFLIDL